MEKETNGEDQDVVNERFVSLAEDSNPMTKTLDVIGGKWKLMLLNKIREECPMRFGVLRKKLPHITQTTLTIQLKELEQDGILTREAYAESPPRVEYKLTDVGKSLIPIMDALCEWGEIYEAQRNTLPSKNK